ncbi:MAG: cytochrome c [Methylocystis sp.]|nr:cytochrome c [Methylocystis sp.]
MIVTLVTSFCLIAPSYAGDAGRGAVIAKRWCASCHVVSEDQISAVADAPPFDEIARRKDKKEIANFLMNPHPPMPDMHLSRKEIDDISTYIRSLDPRPRPPEQKEKDDELPKRG